MHNPERDCESNEESAINIAWCLRCTKKDCKATSVTRCKLKYAKEFEEFKKEWELEHERLIVCLD